MTRMPDVTPSPKPAKKVPATHFDLFAQQLQALARQVTAYGYQAAGLGDTLFQRGANPRQVAAGIKIDQEDLT